MTAAFRTSFTWDEEESPVLLFELAAAWLAEHPSDDQAWRCQGVAQTDLLLFAEAEQSLERALACAPSPARREILLDLGRLAHLRGARAHAFRWLWQALREFPDLVEAHGQLGALLMTCQRYSWAASAYARAVELEPDSPLWQMQHGLALRAAGSYHEAARAFEAVIASNDAAHAVDLEAMLRQESAREALRDFEFVAILEARGELPYAGDRVAVVQRLMVAIMLGAPVTMLWLGRAFRPLAPDPEDVSLWVYRAVALASLNRSAEALKLYKEALERYPTPELMVSLGSSIARLYSLTGLRDYRSAVLWYDEVIRWLGLTERDESYVENKAGALAGASLGRWLLGQRSEAVTLLENASADPDTTAELWCSLSWFLAARREYPRALAAVRRARELGPDEEHFELLERGIEQAMAVSSLDRGVA